MLYLWHTQKSTSNVLTVLFCGGIFFRMDNSNSRPRRDCQYPAAPSAPIDTVCIQCALDAGAVPRATLADRENRELGLEPMDAATAPQFAALGRRRDIAQALLAPKRISSVMEVDLGRALSPEECARVEAQHRRDREGMSARETRNRVRAAIGLPTLPEDRAASEMFDGDAPGDGDDLAAYVSELEADVRRAERHAQTLQAQLDAANARIAQLEAK